MVGAFTMVADSGNTMFALGPPSNRTCTRRLFIGTVTSMQCYKQALCWGCSPQPILNCAQLLLMVGTLGGASFEAFTAWESSQLRADVIKIYIACKYMGSVSSPKLIWYSPVSSGSYCSPSGCSECPLPKSCLIALRWCVTPWFGMTLSGMMLRVINLHGIHGILVHNANSIASCCLPVLQQTILIQWNLLKCILP